MSEPRERRAEYYANTANEMPFRRWRNGLRDDRLKIAVDGRIRRLRVGNFGDSKSVGEGVFEARVHHGAGYRIYYGVTDDEIVLLCGGEKSTQKSDIASAKAMLLDYRERVWKKLKS